MFDTQMLILKYFFKKANFDKNPQMPEYHAKLLNMQKVVLWYMQKSSPLNLFFSAGVLFRCFMSKFGCRICVMAGGIISAAGLGLMMFVTNIYQVYLTYGLMTGTHFCLEYTDLEIYKE